MSQRRKILFSLSIPVFIGMLFFLSLVSTCERFPELELKVTTDSIVFLPDRVFELSGTIESFGREPVTQHGFYWVESTTPIEDGNPIELDNKRSKGNFTSTIFNLQANTKFNIRAYATSAEGTVYGEVKSFTTPAPGLPTVTTTAISNISQGSAMSGGTIIDDGGDTITAKGVCWDTQDAPTIDNNHTTDSSELGSFTSKITGLECGTNYYVRAYATNTAGTSYGNEETFSTLSSSGETVTDFDGNVYQTVQIGDQIWMKENLKVTHFPDGSEIPLVEGIAAWNALTANSKAYCWYDNSASNKDIYGSLYTWAAAMNGASSSDADPSGIQGACPDGWHLPSDVEWTELTSYLGGTLVAGGKMKDTTSVYWDSPNTVATNESDFTGLPGGYRNPSGLFSFKGTNGLWWSSTEETSDHAWERMLGDVVEFVMTNAFLKSGGLSIRCVKDEVDIVLPTITTLSISSLTVSSAE